MPAHGAHPVMPTTSDLELLTPSQEGWIWTVLHTKPRCEKKVAELSALQPSTLYLPSINRVHTYGSRVRSYQVPLFPGYVFGCMPTESLSWYRSNRYVANLIEVVDEKALLTPLKSVALSLAAGMHVDMVAPMGPGTRVQVTGGPLKGLEADVHQIDGTNKVVLEVELIQKMVTIDVDVTYLKRIG